MFLGNTFSVSFDCSAAFLREIRQQHEPVAVFERFGVKYSKTFLSDVGGFDSLVVFVPGGLVCGSGSGSAKYLVSSMASSVHACLHESKCT